MLGFLFDPDDEGAVFIRKIGALYQTTRLYNLEDVRFRTVIFLHASATTPIPILATTHCREKGPFLWSLKLTTHLQCRGVQYVATLL
jgi:hypothetical protein